MHAPYTLEYLAATMERAGFDPSLVLAPKPTKPVSFGEIKSKTAKTPPAKKAAKTPPAKAPRAKVAAKSA